MNQDCVLSSGWADSLSNSLTPPCWVYAGSLVTHPSTRVFNWSRESFYPITPPSIGRQENLLTILNRYIKSSGVAENEFIKPFILNQVTCTSISRSFTLIRWVSLERVNCFASCLPQQLLRYRSDLQMKSKWSGRVFGGKQSTKITASDKTSWCAQTMNSVSFAFCVRNLWEHGHTFIPSMEAQNVTFFSLSF